MCGFLAERGYRVVVLEAEQVGWGAAAARRSSATARARPALGRIGGSLYYLQGFFGHGIARSGMAGRLAAEAIAGQAERFGLYRRLRHRPLAGGRLLRTPALVLGMLWYRLRDLL